MTAPGFTIGTCQNSRGDRQLLVKCTRPECVWAEAHMLQLRHLAERAGAAHAATHTEPSE